MNQILSVENNQKKKTKKIKNTGPVAIESILKFFSIAILIFGVFMIGSGSYSMYNNTQEKTSNTKPTIQVEEGSETEITIRIIHDKALSKVTYKWNNEEEIQIQTNGRKDVEQTIEIPTGDNTLTIYAQDINGQETSYQKAYSLEGDISIDFSLDGNNIKVTATGKNELSYMTYRWDEEEETTVDINNTQIEQDIEIPMGQHTLTVIVVDINNTTETKTQEVKGVTKPQVEITTDGSSNFIIRASDEEGIKRVEFIINDSEEKYVLDLDKVYSIDQRKEFEYSYPIGEGETILEVTVYNESDVSETIRARVNR